MTIIISIILIYGWVPLTVRGVSLFPIWSAISLFADTIKGHNWIFITNGVSPNWTAETLVYCRLVWQNSTCSSIVVVFPLFINQSLGKTWLISGKLEISLNSYTMVFRWNNLRGLNIDRLFVIFRKRGIFVKSVVFFVFFFVFLFCFCFLHSISLLQWGLL